MLIPFGYRKETDEYVDVDDVENGLACNCICPSCDMRFEARHGDEREHHFKHHVKAEKECDFSYWVAVRSMAKQILEQSTVLNIDVERLFADIPWKNQIIQMDIFAINPRRKNHGFDFELLTSIGYIYVYFVTPENESAGRYRAHIKNQPRYFATDLILEVDLTTLSSVKKNAKSRLEKLIIEELDSKTWVSSKYPFKPKPIKPAKQEQTIRPARIINEIVSKNIIVEEDIPNYKKSYVVHKELLDAFGLVEGQLIREYIRTLNVTIEFFKAQIAVKYIEAVRSKNFSIVYTGMNLYFISYENEFYGVAQLGRHYVYQIVDEMVVFIGKCLKLEDVTKEIDRHICERDHVF